MPQNNHTSNQLDRPQRQPSDKHSTSSENHVLAARVAVSISQRQEPAVAMLDTQLDGKAGSNAQKLLVLPRFDICNTTPDVLMTRSFFEEGTVRILVDQEEHAFFIHRRLLLDNVPYFRLCMKQQWYKAKDPIKILDISIESFRFVVSWLYGEKLPDRISKEGRNSLSWRKLDSMYKVADRLMMSKLQNELVDIVLATMRLGARFWRLTRLERLYDLELSHTPYYQLVLKSLVHSLMTSGKTQFKDQDSPVFHEVLATVKDYMMKPWPCPTAMAPDKFHVHDERGLPAPRRNI